MAKGYGYRDDVSIDPNRFEVKRAAPRGFEQAYVHEKAAVDGRRVALLCVHGWPESKRIFWKVIEPLVAAGFDVIVPDLRGFGDSAPAPDGRYDTVSHARDLFALVHDHLGYDKVVVLGGDLGGPVIQDMALRYPDFVDRMVLFNSPLPYDKERMAGMEGTRAPRESADYFVRQGTDADRLAQELSTPVARRAYISTFYTSRFGAYESAFDPAKRPEPTVMGRNDVTSTLVLYGPSDHVIYPAFDRMAAVIFDKHVGPYLLRDCGHFVPWEAPHALVSGTVAFCADLLHRA
jgi:pimeloyl-ACP methyl ester carboxylesterase